MLTIFRMDPNIVCITNYLLVCRARSMTMASLEIIIVVSNISSCTIMIVLQLT